MSLLPEINQASAEINKFVAQANIHQTIAPVNPAAFTDPADTMLLASRDPVIREVSVGMTGEAYSDYSVSGTPPLSLPNSLGKPLKAWEVELSPYQEGSGDPSPSNVRPIHGTDKVTITTAGKNLLDPTKRQNSASNIYWYYNTTGFLLMAGVTYTFSVSTATAQNSIEKIGGGQLAVNYGRTSLTYTSSTDVYVWFNAYFSGGYTPPSGDTSEVQCQLEFGSTASPYTPYLAPSQTVLTLPQTVYTGTIGSDGGESRFGEYIFDGSEEWIKSEQYNYFETISQLPNALNANTNSANQMNSKYAYGDIANTNTVLGSCMIWGRIRVRLADMSISLNDWYNLLEAVPMQVVYKLATPTTFAIPSVTIPTPTGTATTWATAEDGTVESMEVTYIKSE